MKKKIEKKAIQEKPEPQEIKFKYESGRMIFELGDRQFFLKEEDANFLFGRNVEIQFDKLTGGQLEDFSDLDTREFICKFQVVYERFGNLDETAKFLKMDEGRLRHWMNRGDKFKREVLTRNLTETEALKERYTKEFFAEKKKEQNQE